MARFGSHRSRFAVIPAFLLVAAYIVCALPPMGSNDVYPATVASKTHADAGSGRAKMLRPARVQMRLPNPRSGDGKKWSDLAGAAILKIAGIFLEAPQASIGRSRAAPVITPIPLLVRTHSPRDPPRVI